MQAFCSKTTNSVDSSSKFNDLSLPFTSPLLKGGMFTYAYSAADLSRCATNV